MNELITMAGQMQKVLWGREVMEKIPHTHTHTHTHTHIYIYIYIQNNETVLRFGFCDIQNNECLYIYIYIYRPSLFWISQKLNLRTVSLYIERKKKKKHKNSHDSKWASKWA